MLKILWLLKIADVSSNFLRLWLIVSWLNCDPVLASYFIYPFCLQEISAYFAEKFTTHFIN